MKQYILTMDHKGHSSEAFNKADAVGLAEVEKRFAELRKRGVIVALEGGKIEVGADGTVTAPGARATRVLNKYDPNIEVMRFQPHLVGG